MKATIQIANPKRGMYAAQIEGMNEYVIFELLDTEEINIGDVISYSDFYNMGSGTFKNLTQGCNVEVCIENICGIHLVRQQCFLPSN